MTTYGIMVGETTGGTGTGTWRFDSVRNPTTGTLISNGTAITPRNFNVGSNNTLNATVLEADQMSRTFTDGVEPFLGTIRNGEGVVHVVSVFPIIIPKGTAIGANFTAEASNTSQVIQVFALGYLNKLITTDVVRA